MKMSTLAPAAACAIALVLTGCTSGSNAPRTNGPAVNGPAPSASNSPSTVPAKSTPTTTPTKTTAPAAVSQSGCEAAIAVSTATGTVGIAGATNPGDVGHAVANAIAVEKKMRSQLPADIVGAYDKMAADLQTMGGGFDTNAQNVWAADTAPLDHWVTANCQAYKK